MPGFALIIGDSIVSSSGVVTPDVLVDNLELQTGDNFLLQTGDFLKLAEAA